MSNKEERFEEDKFVVIPSKYIERLAMTVRGQLNYVLNRVRALRVEDGIDFHPGYYVVSRDEPYAEDVLNLILEGEKEKANDNWRV